MTSGGAFCLTQPSRNFRPNEYRRVVESTKIKFFFLHFHMDFLVERHPFDSKQGGFSMTSLGVKGDV